MAALTFVPVAAATDIAKVVGVVLGGAVVADAVISDWVRDQSRRFRKLPVRQREPDREDKNS